MSNLEDVILAAVEDNDLPADPTPEVDQTDSPEPVETLETPVEAAPEAVEPIVADPSPEVPSPAESVPEVKPDAKEKPKKEDFDTKYGLEPTSPSGRENRIPYTRVKKIADKAVRDAKKEWTSEYEPKLAESEAKNRDYETKLERVSRFEDVMINKPDQFLDMLSTIPAYQHFFRTIEQAMSGHMPAQAAPPQADPADERPAPNQKLSDGSMVYDEEGLDALMAWQSRQIESKITKQIEDRYKPLESEWETQQQARQNEQRDAQVLSKVRADITEARTWNLFSENETEIVAALKTNPALSLEGAYRKVVFPKLVADRNKIREDVLNEVKRAPRSTSVVAGATKATPSTGEAKSLEEIIAEQVKTLPRA